MIIDNSVRPCMRTIVLECGQTITPEIINKMSSGGGTFAGWLCQCKNSGYSLSVDAINLIAEAVEDNWRRFIESC